jgi:DNA-binding Xre family transcriptional regulator
MIEFNLQRIMTLRGIEEPVPFLVAHGVNYFTARRMLNTPDYRISVEQLEHLCDILNCTPNDVYLFTPSAKTPANHSLRSLCHKEVNVLPSLRNLSPSQVEALAQQLQQEKK